MMKQTQKRRITHAMDDQIRDRAYALYEERGRADGQDVDDWLRAESELSEVAGSVIEVIPPHEL